MESTTANGHLYDINIPPPQSLELSDLFSPSSSKKKKKKAKKHIDEEGPPPLMPEIPNEDDFFVPYLERTAEQTSCFARVFTSPITVVHLTASNEIFQLHQSALISTSKFFAKRLSTEWQETSAEAITLDDEVDTPFAFHCFIQYIYTKSYERSFKSPNMSGYQLFTAIERLLQHAQVYVFAERVEALDLKAEALMQATEICRLGFYCDSIYGSITITPESLKLLPTVIRTIYTSTYDTHAEDLQKLVDKPSKIRKAKEEELVLAPRESASPVPLYGIDMIKGKREEFRILLAKLCSFWLMNLRNEPEFTVCHHNLPDFASDLLQYVTETPNPW